MGKMDYGLGKKRLFFMTSAFWEGVGSLIDVDWLFNLRSGSPAAAKADSDAIRSDWEAVGGYIQEAVGIYSETVGKT